MSEPTRRPLVTWGGGINISLGWIIALFVLIAVFIRASSGGLDWQGWSIGALALARLL